MAKKTENRLYHKNIAMEQNINTGRYLSMRAIFLQ